MVPTPRVQSNTSAETTNTLVHTYKKYTCIHIHKFYAHNRYILPTVKIWGYRGPHFSCSTKHRHTDTHSYIQIKITYMYTYKNTHTSHSWARVRFVVVERCISQHPRSCNAVCRTGGYDQCVVILWAEPSNPIFYSRLFHLFNIRCTHLTLTMDTQITFIVATTSQCQCIAMYERVNYDNSASWGRRSRDT